MNNENNKRKLKVNVPFLIISFICSLVLWVVVTSTNEDEYTRPFTGVGVVFEGEASMRESKGFIITEVDTTSVRLSITGPRRIVYNLESTDISALIDLSSISVTGTYTLSYTVGYPTGTDTSQLKVISRSPSTISFKVDKISKRPIDVYAQFNGSAAEGYSAEPIEVNPATVAIEGPEAAISKVAYALVEVDKQNVDKTLSYDTAYSLIGYDGEVIDDPAIELVNTTVNVTLPILSVKDVALEINVVPGGGATSENVIREIEPAYVTLSGDADTINGINTITLASIDLSAIQDSFTETYNIQIPNDTTLVSSATEATVTVRVKGLETKTAHVTNISYINNTEGFEPTIYSDFVDVILRGSAESIALLEDINVRAIADLSAYGTATGVVSVPVTIKVDGYSDVGAVGEYKVYIKIS